MLRRWGLGVSTAVVLGLASALAAEAGQSAPDETPVAIVQLPREAQNVHRLVRQGGPFIGAKEGAVFGNRERALPPRARGYYREYTVATPGAHDRGARRIVCGGSQPKTPDACYYTADHYNTFRRIAP
ncbi:MAG: ribonuclease N1 [Pseudomonadota bacterium]|nr:ribonuclease N1 [Pseudomonadota bacterium]